MILNATSSLAGTRRSPGRLRRPMNGGGGSPHRRRTLNQSILHPSSRRPQRRPSRGSGTGVTHSELQAQGLRADEKPCIE